MHLNLIHIPSYWGTELKHKHISVHDDNRKLVVIFPGRNYPCELPLLYYAGKAAIQANHDLLLLEYGYQAARGDLAIKDLPSVIEECVEAINQIIQQYKQVTFISKSLGTIVAGEAHRRLHRTINHIYLTPLADTIPFINTTSGAVIYGSNDPFFQAKEINQIVADKHRTTLEIPDANHGLETGDMTHDLAILSRITELYTKILKA